MTAWFEDLAVQIRIWS